MLRSALVVLLLVTPGAQDRPPLPADTLPPGAPPERPPAGLPESFGDPADNPFQAERYQLGRRLFFAPILSVDGSTSCASCHEPERGFASRDALPLGARGRRARRNAPTLLNRAFSTLQFWDGRAASLEDQVLRPIEDPDEMGTTVAAVLARLAGDATWRQQFAAAGLTPERDALARCLALFVRRLTQGDSPVDRFRQGEVAALTTEERSGLWIYESRGRCWSCHGGPNFTDEDFHNTGVGVVAGAAEPGRSAVTNRAEDRGRFKTPTLRGVAATGPYFHDGSAATLDAVVEFYRTRGKANPDLDATMTGIRLEAEDVPRLVAFLRALSRVAPPRAR